MMQADLNIRVTPRDLLAGTIEISSPSDVYFRLTELIDKYSSSISDYAAIIENDPALTVRLLKLVNSAFFGFSGEIATISRAVSIIGIRELRDLVLATTVIDMFQGMRNDLVTMESFWQQSIRCAVLSSIFSSYHQNKNTIESIFVAGLLHQIGNLIIFNKLPELAREAFSKYKYNGVDLHIAEQEVIGFDYASLGGELAGMWKLPPVLRQVITFQFEPEQAGEYHSAAAIVCVAGIIASHDTFEPDEVMQLVPAESTYWKRAGLRDDIVIEALQLAEEKYKATLAMFPIK